MNVQTKPPLSHGLDTAFGTGEWDFGTGASVSQRVGGGFVFADLTYWRLGDPDDLDLENPIAYAVSYGRPFAAGRLSAIATLTGWTGLVAALDPPVRLGTSFGWWSRSRRSLTVGVAGIDPFRARRLFLARLAGGRLLGRRAAQPAA